VRATLHDELMREAGFEGDYYVELARRREGRRKKLRRDVLRATTVATSVGAVVAPLLTRDENARPRRRFRRMWTGVTRSWREDS
jgi:hypothetical protein